MATLSLSENLWRMIRLALRKRKCFRFSDVRNMTRHDRAHLERLIGLGLVEHAASPDDEPRYALTPAGIAAADLGQYQWEPQRAAV